MSTTRKTIALAACFMSFASVLAAQAISIGLRGTGSFPTGSFSQTQTTAPSTDVAIAGAKSGFGYGLDAGLSVGPIGVYASFDHIKFDCETATCQTDGKYTLSGVTGGVKLYLPHVSIARPYVKGGVTFNDLQGGVRAANHRTRSRLTTPPVMRSAADSTCRSWGFSASARRCDTWDRTSRRRFLE